MPTNGVTRAEEINALLATLNPLLFAANPRLRLRYVRVDEVREQDINANVMPQGMFNALANNIGKNSALESVPLMATREETPDIIEIVSGHHRNRAARLAGVDGYVALVYSGLSESEIRAKQLAHNSIAGKSDPEIVREIFSRIESVDEKLESYIDPKSFDAIPDAVSFEMIDLDPLADAKTVTIVFLPTQATDFKKVSELLTDDPDEVYVAHRACFDSFKQAVLETKTELEIVSVPTAIAAMGRLALERLAQLRSERTEREATAARDGADVPERLIPEPRLDANLMHALGADHDGSR